MANLPCSYQIYFVGDVHAYKANCPLRHALIIHPCVLRDYTPIDASRHCLSDILLWYIFNKR